VTWKLHNLAEIWWQEAPKLEGHFTKGGLACVMRQNANLYLSSLRPEDQQILKAYGAYSWSDLMDKNPVDNPPWFPAWQIAASDGTPERLALTKAQDTYAKDLPKVILAKSADFEKEWTSYLADLKKCDLGLFESFMQKGIDELIAKYGKLK
jgi:putative aldouronate transport system substrate-binding protein